MEGERIVLENAIHGYVVRTSWLYSKTHGNNFYQKILAKAISLTSEMGAFDQFLTENSQKKELNDQILVTNDQTGTPTTTDELTKFLYALIEQLPEPGVYHCGGGKIQTWFDFAKDILAEHELDVSIQSIKTSHEGLKRPKFSALATEKNLKR